MNTPTLMKKHKNPPWWEHPDESPPCWIYPPWWRKKTMMKIHPGKNAPWRKTLMKAHPDENPPWSKPTLLNMHPDESEKQTMMKTHPGKNLLWWKKLMKAHTDENDSNKSTHWWKPTLIKNEPLSKPTLLEALWRKTTTPLWKAHPPENPLQEANPNENKPRWRSILAGGRAREREREHLHTHTKKNWCKPTLMKTHPGPHQDHSFFKVSKSDSVGPRALFCRVGECMACTNTLMNIM